MSLETQPVYGVGRRRRSRSRRNDSRGVGLLRYTWIFGGTLVGIAALGSAWRSDTTPVFFWSWAVGGVLVLAAVVSSAAAAARRGSRLAAVGLILFFVGFLTLVFGIGVILVVAGVALYAVGLDRTGVIDRHALLVALTLLALAVATVATPWNQVVGIELAAAAAVAAGLGAGRALARGA